MANRWTGLLVATVCAGCASHPPDAKPQPATTASAAAAPTAKASAAAPSSSAAATPAPPAKPVAVPASVAGSFEKGASWVLDYEMTTVDEGGPGGTPDSKPKKAWGGAVTCTVGAVKNEGGMRQSTVACKPDKAPPSDEESTKKGLPEAPSPGFALTIQANASGLWLHPGGLDDPPPSAPTGKAPIALPPKASEGQVDMGMWSITTPKAGGWCYGTSGMGSTELCFDGKGRLSSRNVSSPNPATHTWRAKK